ncbi:MAG: OsmC family protein [Deltaproteobacteria bacterium]|nr:OsmC family protein [Deltaproteobacteria bacterium]
MEMQINFPGGKRVTSTYKGFTVETDQPQSEGGNGSAPEPYDLFLSSLGTCAGVYIVYFCESRGIPTEDISMTLSFERNEKSHLMEKIAISIHLPPEFPKKYRKAVIRAAEMCTVKRTMTHPPEILVTTGGEL